MHLYMAFTLGSRHSRKYKISQMYWCIDEKRGGGLYTNFCAHTLIPSALYLFCLLLLSKFALLFTCLHSLDNKVLHGLDQDPSLTVSVSAARRQGADVQPNHFLAKKVYPSTGLSFEDKLKFLTALIIEALHISRFVVCCQYSCVKKWCYSHGVTRMASAGLVLQQWGT